MSAVGLRLGDPVYVRIFKETKEIEVWGKLPNREQFELYKIYRICKWSGSLGPKISQDDKQVPEGYYFLTNESLIPNGKRHLELDLGFPNSYDQHHQRNGSSTIHGGCESSGGYAVTDAVVEELYTLAAATFEGGNPFFRVHCFPFRMTDARMDQAVEEDPELLDFWSNLKEGFDYFEIVGRPPNTTLVDGKYAFE